MAENLDKQTQQYQLRFQQFISEIDNGESEVDLNAIQQGFNNIPKLLQKDINQQIDAYQKQSPSQSVAGFVNFLGKKTANAFLGPIGLSFGDFQNPQRLADKAKSTALKSVQGAIATNVPNPSTIIRSIKNRGRGLSDEDKMANEDLYENSKAQRRLMQNPDYNPISYEDEQKLSFPEKHNRIKILQNNNGTNFYSTYKVLHDEDDEQISEGLSEYLIKFHITNDDKLLIFRMANFSGFTDSLSVSYNDVRYFGRPEVLKQYDSVTRNVSFSFDVVVDNEEDIYPIYKKLDILTGLCYPNSYTNDNIIQPNIIKLSVGKYFKKTPFFPTSLTYTADEEMVTANGKPRALTVTVNGDIIQPESNPKTNAQSPFNSFIDAREFEPARFVSQGDAAIIDGSVNRNDRG